MLIYIRTSINKVDVELRIESIVIIVASKRKAWTCIHGGITLESHSPAHCASTQLRTGNCYCDTRANTTPLRTPLYSGRGVHQLPEELEPPNNTDY